MCKTCYKLPPEVSEFVRDMPTRIVTPPKPRRRRPVGDSGPGLTFPAEPPLPEPPPPSSPAMPRYLREALKAEASSRSDERPTREQVIRSLGEMSWEERQEELRIPRIYPGREPHT